MDRLETRLSRPQSGEMEESVSKKQLILMTTVLHDALVFVFEVLSNMSVG